MTIRVLFDGGYGMYAIPIVALLIAIIFAFKLPIFKTKDSPIAHHESDDDRNFSGVVKHVAPPKPPMEVHTMFDVGDDAEKSHPLPYDTTGLTYDYWG